MSAWIKPQKFPNLPTNLSSNKIIFTDNVYDMIYKLHVHDILDFLDSQMKWTTQA